MSKSKSICKCLLLGRAAPGESLDRRPLDQGDHRPIFGDVDRSHVFARHFLRDLVPSRGKKRPSNGMPEGGEKRPRREGEEVRRSKEVYGGSEPG